MTTKGNIFLMFNRTKDLCKAGERFAVAIDRVLNEHEVNDPEERTTIKLAINRLFGPGTDPRRRGNMESFMACAQVLYRYGFDVKKAVEETLRQFGIHDERDRAPIRKVLLRELGSHGGRRTAQLRRAKKQLAIRFY